MGLELSCSFWLCTWPLRTATKEARRHVSQDDTLNPEIWGKGNCSLWDLLGSCLDPVAVAASTVQGTMEDMLKLASPGEAGSAAEVWKCGSGIGEGAVFVQPVKSPGNR